MGKSYQNKLTVFLASLLVDLKSGKLTEKEFKFLLGIFLQREMNNFVKESLDEMLPKFEDVHNLTMVSYKKITYAKPS
jgi:hypothetical protein